MDLNWPPNAPYNGRMPSRPQFSLRMLFFMTAMVCLASATVAELPEEQTSATAAQDVLRVVLCIVFPAMFLAQAIAKRGYERTMYLGGLFAASIPLLRAFATLYGRIASEPLQTFSQQLFLFPGALWLDRRAFAVMWALIPCASLICFLVHWLWRRGEQARETARFSAAQFALRLALASAATLFAAYLAVYKVQGHPRLADAQNLLIVTFIVVFPALLVAGAVQANGPFRTFCLGAALPSVFPLILVCDSLVRNVAQFDSPTDWSITLACLSVERYSTAGFCVCAPLFGLACVCLHRLLERWAAKEKDSDAVLFRPNAKELWLLATVMGCLAAGTIIQLPAERELAAISQGAIRMAICIMFPSFLLAGAVVTRSYARTLCIGGLFAASVPLATAFGPLFDVIANHWLQTVPKPLDAFAHGLGFLRRPFAVMWALTPCAAYACFFVHRLWRQGDEARETATLSAAQIESRAALTAAAAVLTAIAAVGTQSHGLFAAVQKPLMIALTVVFPALLVIGAVAGTGRFRVFCIGGALPATFALTWVCMWLARTVYYFDSATDWSTALACLTQHRRSTAALWACAPLVGMVCVFFHWLFQRGGFEAKHE